ncbi:MAG: hypothetical protein ACOYU7_02155 [Bacillota bacterium]
MVQMKDDKDFERRLLADDKEYDFDPTKLRPVARDELLGNDTIEGPRI